MLSAEKRKRTTIMDSAEVAVAKRCERESEEEECEQGEHDHTACEESDGECCALSDNEDELPELPSCEMLAEYLVIDVASLCAGESKAEDEHEDETVDEDEEKLHGHENDEYSAKDVAEARLVSMQTSRRFWPPLTGRWFSKKRQSGGSLQRLCSLALYI
jgi:hypothetical protein